MADPPPRGRSSAGRTPIRSTDGRDDLADNGSAARSQQRGCTNTAIMAREGVPLVVIQRQLGHANLGITSRLG